MLFPTPSDIDAIARQGPNQDRFGIAKQLEVLKALIAAAQDGDAGAAAGAEAALTAAMAAAADAAGRVSRAGDTMEGSLGVPDGIQAGHAVNRGQLDAASDEAQAAAAVAQATADSKVAKGGDTMEGNLTVPDGSAAGHAVTKAQLDAAAAGKISRAGDSMIGPLSVPGATDPSHAVNRQVLDAATTAMQLLVAQAQIPGGQSLPFEQIDNPTFAYAMLDSTGKQALVVKADGTLLAKLGIGLGVTNGLSLTRQPDGSYVLSLGSTAGALPVGEYTVDGSLDNPAYGFAIVDAAGRRAFSIGPDGTVTGKFQVDFTEVVTARGAQPSLDARLSRYFNPYGSPKNPIWGEWLLRETRQRLRLRSLGEGAQLVMAMIGDSYTHNAARYSGPSASTLKALYGDAGPGWIGFGFNGSLINGNILDPTMKPAYTGIWASHYGTSISPDVCDAYSSTAGDQISVAGIPATCSAAKLYYVAGAGQVQYRWNNGAWTPLDLSAGSGLGIATLAGLPAGGGTFDVQAISGTVTLCGLELQKGTDGVRVHKLGATGSRAAQWAAVDQAQWQVGLAALNPRLVTILHGTNDQGAARSAAQFATDLATIVQSVRAALPYADILLMPPAENQRTANAYPMTQYAAAMYEVAVANRCAFMDLQAYFGDSSADYAAGSGRPWYNVDGIHPEPASGGRVIVDALLRLLTSR